MLCTFTAYATCRSFICIFVKTKYLKSKLRYGKIVKG